MTYTVRTTIGTEATGNNASLTVGIPSSTTTDDVIFALLTGRNGTTGTWAAPSGYGWGLVYSVRSTTAGGSVYLFAKRYASGDPSSYTFTWSGGGTNQTTLGQSLAVGGIPTGWDIDSTLVDQVSFNESSSSNYSLAQVGFSVPSGELAVCLGWANNDVVNTGHTGASRFLRANDSEWTSYIADQTASSSGSDAMQSLWLGVSPATENPKMLWAVATAAAAIWVGIKIRNSQPVEKTSTASLAAVIVTAKTAQVGVDAVVELPPGVADFHLGGLVCSYPFSQVTISNEGQRVSVVVNGVAWPVRQLTIRTSASLNQEVLLQGVIDESAPEEDQTVVISLTANIAGEPVTTEIFSGLVTQCREAYRERVLTAVATVSGHTPRTLTLQSVMVESSNMTRLPPDYFSLPGDMIDDGRVIDNITTAIGVGQTWFTEYHYG